MAPTDTYNTLMSRFKKPNKQSQTNRESQQQVIPRVTPTLTAADIEKEKTGSNGEVVQLGDAKPATPATPEKPATASTPQTPAEPKPALTPEDTKLTMPGLKQEKIKGLEGVDTSPKSLKEWFSWYDEQKRRMGLETDADREKREKKEKAERIIAAIGDGISALTQIHYAGKGAVVNPGTGTTLSEGVSKRLERLRQQRDAQENKVLNLLRQRKQDELAQKKADLEAARAEQAAKHQASQEKYWESQGKRWEDYAEHQRRQDEERERANKAKEEETKRNHDMTEKGKNDRAAASRAAANSRNKYNQSQQTARQREREAAKDKRAKEKQQSSTKKTLPGQTKPKTKKKLPK